jgi:hypothetical protein
MCCRLFRFGLLASAPIVGGLIAWGAFPETVTGTGKAATEDRPVGSVTEVNLSGVGTLTVVQGEVPALVVTADDNILPLIETETSGRKLTIRTRSGFNLRPKTPIAYTLTIPRLAKLTISGAGNAKADKLTGDELAVRLTGAGTATLREVNCKALSLTLSGAGTATVAGTAEKAKLRISGAGDIHAAGLQVKTADIKVSGAGDASIWATDALKARVSGAGDVTYKGEPKVEKKVSGAGSVKPAKE